MSDMDTPPSIQCPLFSLGGSCQERPRSPGIISSLEELWQTHPSWCRHCSEQGQSFINYSGDSAIMQISGQPLPDCCLPQEFSGGWRCPEPKQLGARREHPAHKRGNKPLQALGPQKPGPTPHTGELVAALRNGSEDLGMPYSRKTHPSSCFWASNAIPQDLLLWVLKAWNTSKVPS